jgi:hypothetical protein
MAEIVEDVKEKWPKGRRSASTRPTIVKTFKIRVKQVGWNEAVKRQYICRESCFVIISNITDKATSDHELLKIYKGQHVVENSFRLLKGPNLASVIYLKNEKRIQALTTLLSLSLLIRAIIQYRMRDGLKKHEEEKPNQPIYAGWAGRPLKAPTFKLLFEHSINCYYEREQSGEYSFTWIYPETRNLVEPLLSLMGLSVVSIME